MSRTSFGFQFGEPPRHPAREVRTRPLRILVLGDLTCRASRGEHAPETLGDRRPLPLDPDNFESMLARLAPVVHIPLSASGDGVAVTIRTLDDLHPDSLFEQLPVFAALRASRRRLLNPATFAEEAARLQSPGASPGVTREPPSQETSPLSPARGERVSVKGPGLGSESLPTPAANKEPSGPEEAVATNDAGLLRQILSASNSQAEQPPAAKPLRVAGMDLERLVDEAIAPYVIPRADPRQPELVAAVDDAAAELLRRILHAPAFQRCEAAWRQLWRLTRALAGENDVVLSVLDATRAELYADLAPQDNPAQAARLRRALVAESVAPGDAHPWDVIVVLEAFGRSAEDAEVLAALGGMVLETGGVLLADAACDVVGIQDWRRADDVDNWRLDDTDAERRWAALRGAPFASRIGLAAPRLLVRLPYGRGNATQQFPFEELRSEGRHDDLLWGHAALGVAETIGLAFRRDGWSLQPNTVQDIDDLPPCVYDEQGETQLQPAAELFLTVRTAELLADRGVTPLLSYRNRHAARVMAFRSLALPPQPLAGPWTLGSQGRS